MPATATLPRANTRNSREPFPAAQFTKIPNVAIFCEHETDGPDGEKQVFDREKLQTLVDNGNARIRQSGDYAAVCIGHTSDPGEGGTQPEVIGHMGPFRLGVLGNPGQKQKFAILADLWIRKDKASLYNSCPRRSVELWYKDGQPEFIDPLSLLAEAPRLDLGLAPLIDAKGGDGASTGEPGLKYLYSAKHGGFAVVKYAAAAFDGCSDVLTPQQYQAEQGDSLMLSPEEIEQIVDAIKELDVIVAMDQIAPMLPKIQEMVAAHDEKLQGANEQIGHELGETPEEEALEEGEAIGEDEELGAEIGMEPGTLGGEAEEPGPEGSSGLEGEEEPVPTPGESEPMPPEGEEPQKFSLNENSSDEEVAKYMAHRESCKAKYAAEQGSNPTHAKTITDEIKPEGKSVEGDVKSKYSRLEQEVESLRAERIARIEENRAARLAELRHLRVFDYDKELQRCRYSKMNDDQAFNERVADISENYRPTSVREDLPVPREILAGKTTGSPMATKPQRYTKEASEKAVRYCTTQASLGVDTDYATVLDNIANGRPAEFKG